jgi:hypothetical protein
MGNGVRNFQFFGRLEPGLSAMRGSAAWAQTQLTPGVSVLAAPHPNIRTHRDSAGQQAFRSMAGTLR